MAVFEVTFKRLPFLLFLVNRRKEILKNPLEQHGSIFACTERR